MYVNIFKLENPDEPVTTLNGGCHVLGRGTMLRCFDKRVSRNHAKLHIGDNNVSLTSTHVNPCFHRSVGGKTITIIVKDQTKELQNGDQFALLADQVWYRMEIQEVKDENENKSPQLTQNVGVSGTNRRVSAGNETICVMNQSNQVDSKDGKEDGEDEPREKAEKPEDFPSIEKNSEHQVNIDDEPNVCEKVDEGMIEANHIEDVPGPSGISHNNITEDASQSLLHTNITAICSNVPDDSQPIVVSSEDNGTSQKRNLSDDVCTSPKKRRKVLSDEEDDPKTPEEQMDVSVGRNDEVEKVTIVKDESAEDESQLELCLVESSEDMKKEGEQVSQVQDEDHEANKQTQNGNEGKEESLEYVQKEEAAKQSTGNDIETVHTSEDNGETSQCAREEEANKEVADDNEQAGAKDNNTTDADPSTSGVPGPASTAVKRERCWYGTSCYRKHPNHKVHFSHPGDDDYDDDAKDDRPTCAYGINCYRRNLNHRRQYRHPGPPAPRPNNGNDGRPRRAAARRVNYNENNTPDDYDHNDPFIDDGSSDEYHVSDDSDSGRETDFTPSQDSEDIGGLVQDAKKFMNQ